MAPVSGRVESKHRPLGTKKRCCFLPHAPPPPASAPESSPPSPPSVPPRSPSAPLGDAELDLSDPTESDVVELSDLLVADAASTTTVAAAAAAPAAAAPPAPPPPPPTTDDAEAPDLDRDLSPVPRSEASDFCREPAGAVRASIAAAAEEALDVFFASPPTPVGGESR